MAPDSFVPAQSGTRLPAYVVVAQMLRQDIWAGHWDAGDTLPSEQEFAAQFAVSTQTLRRALQMLREEGLVETRHGLGTTVRELPQRDTVKLFPGDSLITRLALPEEQKALRISEGVPVFIVVHHDGTEEIYDGNRTVITPLVP